MPRRRSAPPEPQSTAPPKKPRTLRPVDSDEVLAKRSALRARLGGTLPETPVPGTPPPPKPPDGRKKPVRDRLEAQLSTVWNRMVRGEPLTRILDDLGFDWNTFDDLMTEREPLKDKYRRATDAMLAWWADEVITISDDRTHDTIVDDKGRERPDNEWINRTKLRVDSRKWLLSKLRPQRFGEKPPYGEDEKVIPYPVLALPPLREQPE